MQMTEAEYKELMAHFYFLRWQVGILGYLIAEMKTSKHTNKQKYRLRLFNFSTLRRREIFIFINEECMAFQYL